MPDTSEAEACKETNSALKHSSMVAMEALKQVGPLERSKIESGEIHGDDSMISMKARVNE